MTTVLLAVGDASGDVYAADFVRELRALRPETRFLGLGGGEMEKAGVELAVNQRDFAVGGLVELAPHLYRIASAWRRLGGALDALRPDLVVLVDSSGFNLPFARRAKRAGIPVLTTSPPRYGPGGAAGSARSPGVWTASPQSFPSSPPCTPAPAWRWSSLASS